jgi:hypothetical protein
MTKQTKRKPLILPVRKDKTTNQKRVTIPKEIKTDYVEVQEHE